MLLFLSGYYEAVVGGEAPVLGPYNEALCRGEQAIVAAFDWVQRSALAFAEWKRKIVYGVS